MKPKLKNVLFLGPAIIVGAVWLLPTMYWQFYWFNYRLMNRIAIEIQMMQ